MSASSAYFCQPITLSLHVLIELIATAQECGPNQAALAHEVNAMRCNLMDYDSDDIASLDMLSEHIDAALNSAWQARIAPPAPPARTRKAKR